MSDKRDQPEGERPDALLSVRAVAHFDAFLDQLSADRRPASDDLSAQELADRLLAARLCLARQGVEVPAPGFLDTRALRHREDARAPPTALQPR